ncbi:MAG: Gfo/Idh/MocA family oxidoreductase [Pseudomonadota bacterium]
MKVAVAGAGYFSQFHYDAWRRIEGVDLVGATDLNPDALKERAPDLPHFTDFGAMMLETRPDLIDIVTPPDTHFGMIRGAVIAGAQAVICQKPFCNDLEEAEAAVYTAEQGRMTVVVHENFRFQPWYRAAALLIAEGVLGEVMQVTFRLRPGDGQGPEAYLDRQPYFQKMPRFLVHETAVHWVDTFRFLLGEPETVWADLRQLNPAIAGEDAGIIVFGYSSGARAVLDGNRLVDHVATNRRRTMGECLIEGTRMSILIDGEGRLLTRTFGENEWTDTELNAPESGFGGDCVYALQNHVVDALLSGATPENTARDYLNVIRTEQAIYKSHETGQRISL